MRKIALMLAVIAGMTVVSCKTAGEIRQTEKEQKVSIDQSKELAGDWTLVSMKSEGKELKDLFPNKIPKLNFEIATKRVNGNDGCNNIMGEYIVKAGNIISLGDKMASTMMFCSGVADREYMQTLQSVTSYEIVDGKLILKSGEDIVLTFLK
ncbi:META domain-containing protein [Myroides phaeus]|uniref:META domain-containing protein n=1 Tax=Myroides phaeus TaxID=702745 RepID=UPI002DB7CC14|nr:META domain-containing protein [Myroides phaeus]MEC4117044.1 META domain-containing protein [Myroides phaeus]